MCSTLSSEVNRLSQRIHTDFWFEGFSLSGTAPHNSSCAECFLVKLIADSSKWAWGLCVVTHSDECTYKCVWACKCVCINRTVHSRAIHPHSYNSDILSLSLCSLTHAHTNTATCINSSFYSTNLLRHDSPDERLHFPWCSERPHTYLSIINFCPVPSVYHTGPRNQNGMYPINTGIFH